MLDTSDIHYELATLSHLIRREMELSHSFSDDKLTAANGQIIFYLHCNKDKEIFQKDIEEKFQIRPSTVSKILKLMEKKGLVRRGSMHSDARLKRIVLTDEACKIAELIKADKKKLSDKLLKNLTDEETDFLIKILRKIKANVCRARSEDSGFRQEVGDSI